MTKQERIKLIAQVEQIFTKIDSLPETANVAELQNLVGALHAELSAPVLNKATTNNAPAYDYLDSTHLQWGRKDSKHIFVWEQGCSVRTETEAMLKTFGFIKMSEEFDKICGKTMSIYKHK